MLQNPCKTLGFKENTVYRIPSWGGGGGKPYSAGGLLAIYVLWLMQGIIFLN